MESVNEAYFSNITFLLSLFEFPSAAAVFATDIVLLTSMHASL